MSKLKKGHNSIEMLFELSPLIVWIALWIEKTYSEFQVNIFSNNRDITKCQKCSKSKKVHNSEKKKKKKEKKCILNCFP